MGLFPKGIVVLHQIWTAISQNPWILALATVIFFVIKGVLWLTVPFLLVRWRRFAVQRREESRIDNRQDIR